MLIYNITVPAAVPGVASGLLKLQFGDAVQSPIATAVDQTVVSGVRIPEGTEVSGSFAFVRSNGNVSEVPALLALFTAVNTLPAPNPEGAVTAVLVGEE